MNTFKIFDSVKNEFTFFIFFQHNYILAHHSPPEDNTKVKGGKSHNFDKKDKSNGLNFHTFNYMKWPESQKDKESKLNQAGKKGAQKKKLATNKNKNAQQKVLE